MSVVFSGTFSGRIVQTATASDQFIPLPSGVDWMTVYNETVLYAGGAGTGAQYYWQRGMTQGRGLIYSKIAADQSLVPTQIAAGAGFYLYDNSINTPGAVQVIAGISGATPPVATAAIVGLNNGNIVRLTANAGALQLQGIDFTVSNVGGGFFTLANMATIVASINASSYRIIPYDPYFYPPYRIITKISNAANAIVTLSVTHAFTVGQKIRFKVPTVTALAFGMTQLDGVEATILAIGTADVDGATNTITINVDTTAMGAFAWPLTTDGVFTPAQVIPVGENTAAALAAVPQANILGDAEQNTATMGMLLKSGANSPAGIAAQTIYWVAGKSFN